MTITLSRRYLAVPVAFAIAAFMQMSAAAEPAFVPKAKAWDRWNVAGPGADVDYAPWGAFLAQHVTVGADEIARVAYDDVTEDGRAKLTALVNDLEAVPVRTLTKAQQKAYWINLYNAATVELIVKHYPVSTIRKVHGGIFRTGPWDRDILTVDGTEISLNDIEHRILRPLFGDPRIHFAVNCASLGCPNLASEPFVAERLDAQLDAAASNFFNHPRAFQADGDDLKASSLFHWYNVDFGGPAGLIAAARGYAKPKLAALLDGRSDWDSHDYDWDLNDAR